MKFSGHYSEQTKQVTSITLNATNDADEKLLSAITNAFQHGYEMRIETPIGTLVYIPGNAKQNEVSSEDARREILPFSPLERDS